MITVTSRLFPVRHSAEWLGGSVTPIVRVLAIWHHARLRNGGSSTAADIVKSAVLTGSAARCRPLVEDLELPRFGISSSAIGRHRAPWLHHVTLLQWRGRPTPAGCR